MNMSRNILRLNSSLRTLFVSNSKRISSRLLSTNNNLDQQNQEPQMDEFKANPYFAKYASKLKAVYNENPDQFFKTLKERMPEKVGDLPEEFKSKLAETFSNKKKTLDSIMKLDLVKKDLPAEEINNIWSIYLEQRSRIAGMLTADDYKKIIKRTKEFPTFLFALPRTQGYEFILAQWSNNECHLTPLINFQAHGENAPSTLMLTYFDELAESKQIVLEMGEVDTQHLKLEEARLLVHQMKSYYLHASEDLNDEKYALLSSFTKKPNEFKHMDIIKQLEKDNLKIDQFIKETSKKVEEHSQ